MQNYFNSHKSIQYRQSLENKIRDVDKKISNVSGLVTTKVKKVGEVENKVPDTSGLVTTTVLDTKIGEVENKILYINKFI